MKVLVPLAEGFEEIEAITIMDILRRAEIDVTSVYIKKNPVMGAHHIEVSADKSIDEVNSSNFDVIVLPGGMPGSTNLKNDERVNKLIKDIHAKKGYISAICAAPIVPGHAGLLDGKNATCYPGFENQLGHANYTGDPVTVDDNIITGKGPGCAIPFALKLVEIIKNKNLSEQLKNGMQVYWM
jgi:4-methyl-5(b-hydroxyethyl)-thiazole monophosphate biosynthesis